MLGERLFGVKWINCLPWGNSSMYFPVLNSTGSMTTLPAWGLPCLLPSHKYLWGIYSIWPVQPQARPRRSSAILEGYFGLPIIFGQSSQLVNLGVYDVLCQNELNAVLVSVHLLLGKTNSPECQCSNPYFLLHQLHTPGFQMKIEIPTLVAEYYSRWPKST